MQATALIETFPSSLKVTDVPFRFWECGSALVTATANDPPETVPRRLTGWHLDFGPWPCSPVVVVVVVELSPPDGLASAIEAAIPAAKTTTMNAMRFM